MKRATWLLALALALMGLTGCRESERPTQNLVLTGSYEMGPLLRAIGKRFEAARLDVRVNVEPSNSDKGVSNVRQGLADLGMVARPLRGEEIGLSCAVLAQDGVALLVNKSNPVSALSDEQVAGLYLGTYTNWKQVGGSDRPVVLIEQDRGRAARVLFRTRFGLKTSTLRVDQVAWASAEVVQAVADQPAAVGYGSLGQAVAAVEAGRPIRLLPMNGTQATQANLVNGTYPLRQPLNLVTRQPTAALAGEFIEFARSSECDDLVRKHGFLPAR